VQWKLQDHKVLLCGCAAMLSSDQMSVTASSWQHQWCSPWKTNLERPTVVNVEYPITKPLHGPASVLSDKPHSETPQCNVWTHGENVIRHPSTPSSEDTGWLINRLLTGRSSTLPLDSPALSVSAPPVHTHRPLVECHTTWLMPQSFLTMTTTTLSNRIDKCSITDS